MLGENIKTYRQKKGYTQEEVANRLHVTRQTISKWEKNYSVPDAEVFVKLADVLEVQTSQLLEVKVDSDVQTTEEKQNAYAEQLAHIAEQMAIRNRQRKRIWKTIGIAFAVIIVVCIILIVMNIAFLPVWTDGLHHEFEILEHCYRKSLQKALELKCESIAFPLISTGVYGFPKDKALQIAVSVFSQFLTENEMEIILVVFDKRSFQLSGQIVGDIDSYIDANYVREIHRKEYPLRSRRSTHVKELAEEDFNEEMLQREEDNYPLEEMTDTGMTELLMPLENISLEDQLANIGVSFHDKLFELIDEAHLDNKDVWKRANLDRKHFSKIQCDQNYHPKKKTVMALCIALQLDLEQSRDLLARADWAFSPSSKVDLIVQKAIIDKQYDIMQLNVTLFKYTNEILGV